jgi:hypothetical protein
MRYVGSYRMAELYQAYSRVLRGQEAGFVARRLEIPDNPPLADVSRQAVQGESVAGLFSRRLVQPPVTKPR